MSTRINCDDITFVEGCSPLGVFANAFRVVNEQNPECLLDFLLYSASENRAQIIARVRVRRDMLGAIRDRLYSHMVELGLVPQESGGNVVMGEDGLVSVDGKLVVLGRVDGDN